MNQSSPVTYHRGDDSQMHHASAKARESFKYFFNCISQDFNRIVPACELACVKVPFCDDFSDPDAHVEHMWVDGVDFDGVDVFGELLNSPNELQSVSEGDRVAFPLDQVGDWLCVLDDQVYGGFTVQLIRSRMELAERAQHDAAWELSFPEPDCVQVPEVSAEFETAIAGVLAEQISQEPKTVEELFDGGRTILHLVSLYGRVPSVKVLLESGANVDAKCQRGWTARDYAASLGWTEIMQMLDHAK